MTRFRLRSVLLASMMVFVGLMFVSVPGHRAPVRHADAHTAVEVRPPHPHGTGSNSFATGSAYGYASGTVGPKFFGLYPQRSALSVGYAEVTLTPWLEESQTDYELEVHAIARAGNLLHRKEVVKTPPNKTGSLFRIMTAVTNPNGTKSIVWSYHPKHRETHSEHASTGMRRGWSHSGSGRGISSFSGISLAPFAPLVPGHGTPVRVGDTAVHPN